jgi:hypothetical protein
MDPMEAYKNYEVQRTILPVSTPFRIWKYEIRNTATNRKFTFEVRIKDSLELNLMSPEDLQKTVERRIKWYLDQEMEGDRIIEIQQYDKSL